MSERKEITIEQFVKAKEKGLDYILDNVQVSGTAVIRDKDGNIKGELALSNEIEDK